MIFKSFLNTANSSKNDTKGDIGGGGTSGGEVQSAEEKPGNYSQPLSCNTEAANDNLCGH